VARLKLFDDEEVDKLSEGVVNLEIREALDSASLDSVSLRNQL
jgi:hypothetical protein